VWGVTAKRSLQRKFTDYIALFLLLPLLMVCSAGITIFMSDAVQHVFEGNPLSPVMHRLLGLMPTVISWIIFTAAYWLIPNTRVNIKHALLAGVLAGTLFQGVQWLFVTGQVYVSKYNAIYGSFAFLPLMLVWMQLSWLIMLSGTVLTYACQNFDAFTFHDKAKNVSQNYANQMAIAVLALAAKKFKLRQPLLTREELVTDYDMPGILAEQILTSLKEADLLAVVYSGKNSAESYGPAYDPDELTVNTVLNALANQGNANFMVKADGRFGQLIQKISALREKQQASQPDIALLDLIEQ
jgi:membrane protein